MTQKNAILKLLTPYLKDRSLRCVNEQGSCKYSLGKKMCVFAKACTVKGRKLLQEGRRALSLINKHGEKALLYKKYQGLFEAEVWNMIQSVHDTDVSDVPTRIEILERKLGISLEELRDI